MQRGQRGQAQIPKSQLYIVALYSRCTRALTFENDRLYAASLAPLPRPSLPAGGVGAGGRLAPSQDAVQEGLDNPPHGGWLPPRGQGAAIGDVDAVPSDSGGSSGSRDGVSVGNSACPPTAAADCRAAESNGDGQAWRVEVGEDGMGRDLYETPAVVASLKAAGMQVIARLGE